MNGIIVIDKPPRFTSFDVVAVMRGLFGTKKVGHTGTLDPMATGVLPILIGSATKAQDLTPDSGKEYVAGFRLGVVTDTEDSTGTVKETFPVTADEKALESALSHSGEKSCRFRLCIRRSRKTASGFTTWPARELRLNGRLGL